jgi:hypothetical protein
MPFSISDLEGMRPDLTSAQKESTLALYGAATAAFAAAGYQPESIHDQALLVALSRLDPKLLRIDAADFVPTRNDGRVQRVMSATPIEVVRYDEETGILTAKVRMIRMTVLPYMDADGTTVYECKPAEEFATPAFMGGMPGRPVADLHPRSSNGRNIPFCDMASDAQRAFHTKGVLHTDAQSFYVDGDVIVGIESIFDRDLIADVLSGKKVEVSAGILAKVEDRRGIYDGKQYTKVQTRPVFDHLAHVTKGRAGPGCRALISISDGAEELSEESVRTAGGNDMPGEKEVKTMKLAINDGLYISFSMDGAQQLPTEKEVGAFQAAIDALRTDAAELPTVKAKVDALEAEKLELQKKIDTAEGRADGKDDQIRVLTTKVDELQTKVTAAETGAQARTDAAIDERLEMIDLAREVIGDAYEFKGKDAKAIRVNVLKALNPDVKLDGRNDDYVLARFDAAVEAYRKQASEPVGAHSVRGRNDDGRTPEEIQKERTARTDGVYRDPNKTETK